VLDLSPAATVARTKLAPATWPTVFARHQRGESLRALAADYGVSHEAIRQIVRRAAA